jgi:ATP-dependent Lon protease
MSSVVMFPYLLMPLVVSDEESKLVIDYALSNDKLMAFFLDKEGGESDVTELASVGTAERFSGCCAIRMVPLVCFYRVLPESNSRRWFRSRPSLWWMWNR